MEIEMFRRHGIELFLSAINSVLPETVLQKTVHLNNGKLIFTKGREIAEINVNHNAHVVGFGKAALHMACAIQSILGPHIKGGVLSVPQGSEGKFGKMLTENSNIVVIEGAANNLPDENAAKAAKCIEKYVKMLQENDLLVVLISGGGSALLPSPIPPITLDEKRFTTQLVASRGATIQELNTVRKNLSTLKGGGLATFAYPAQVVSLILSDIIGDPLDLIASGPTVPNKNSPQEALQILKKFKIESEVPESVIKVLSSSCLTSENSFSHVNNIIIGSNSIATTAAEMASRKLGYSSITLTNALKGEAKLIGEYLAILAISISKFLSSNDQQFDWRVNIPAVIIENLFPENKLAEFDSFLKEAKSTQRPVCILTGGETTVTLTSSDDIGLGGRNQELILSAGIHVDKFNSQSPGRNDQVFILSAGTDGLDGPTTSAGAVTYLNQLSQARDQKLDFEKYLLHHDSNSYFSKLNNGNDLVVTGHTGTNVMDMQIILAGKF